MNLEIVDGRYSVCRLGASCSIPEWVYESSFYSISKSIEELSILCETSLVPENVESEDDWCLIKVAGPLDFSLTGVLAALSNPLADKEISIFAISTFDTDYLLVKLEKLKESISTLEESGFVFNSEKSNGISL